MAHGAPDVALAMKQAGHRPTAHGAAATNTSTWSGSRLRLQLPGELSLGTQQCVSLARALSSNRGFSSWTNRSRCSIR